MRIHHPNETTQQREVDVSKVPAITNVNYRRSLQKKMTKADEISDEDFAQVSHKIDKITNPETGDVKLRCKICPQTFSLFAKASDMSLIT